MPDGHLYELKLDSPARFRAAGLDVANRVAREVQSAMTRVLEDQPGEILLEDPPYLSARVMPCSSEAGCRAPLHYKECPRHAAP